MIFTKFKKHAFECYFGNVTCDISRVHCNIFLYFPIRSTRIRSDYKRADIMTANNVISIRLRLTSATDVCSKSRIFCWTLVHTSITTPWGHSMTQHDDSDSANASTATRWFCSGDSPAIASIKASTNVSVCKRGVALKYGSGCYAQQGHFNFEKNKQ